MPTKVTIPPEPDIPETVNINGVDYSPEDAANLIELGKHTQELEKQWDTPVDKVWPEYGKTREELKTTAAERDQLKQDIAKFQEKKEIGTETPTDLKDAREAAKKLGIILDEDLDARGYIKKEDLPGYLNSFSQQQDEVKKVLDNATGLETEIDGSDGRPAFNKKAVLAYAAAYDIADLKEAYEDMNKGLLDKWKEAQIASQKAKGIKTFGAGGKKEPVETKVTDDNVSELMKEQLFGGKEE